MKNLVKLENNVPVVSTLDIWEGLEVKHKAIIDLIRKYEQMFSELGTLAFELQKSGGRPTPFCFLNEEQIKLVIVLMKNSKTIVKLKYNILLGNDIIKEIRNLDKTQKKEGYVYLIQKADNLIKIGCTINPKERIAAIQTHTGEYFLNIFISNKTVHYKAIERKMHSIYKESRMIGEWFDIDYQSAKKMIESFVEIHGKTLVPNFKQHQIASK